MLSHIVDDKALDYKFIKASHCDYLDIGDDNRYC